LEVYRVRLVFAFKAQLKTLWPRENSQFPPELVFFQDLIRPRPRTVFWPTPGPRDVLRVGPVVGGALDSHGGPETMQTGKETSENLGRESQLREAMEDRAGLRTDKEVAKRKRAQDTRRFIRSDDFYRSKPITWGNGGTEKLRLTAWPGSHLLWKDLSQKGLGPPIYY
jgi:hypothetical protein